MPSNLCNGPETAFWEKLLEMFMRADATFQRVPDGAAQADLSTATSGYSEVMSLRSIGETSRLHSQSWFVSVIAVYNSYFRIARDSVSTIESAPTISGEQGFLFLGGGRGSRVGSAAVVCV